VIPVAAGRRSAPRGRSGDLGFARAAGAYGNGIGEGEEASVRGRVTIASGHGRRPRAGAARSSGEF
jgi:hypothetical protein